MPDRGRPAADPARIRRRDPRRAAKEGTRRNMIDPLSEDLIPPTEATSLFPRNRRGKRLHVTVIYRYMSKGCRGVVLESLRTPRLVTSRQAVARFIRRLSEL